MQQNHSKLEINASLQHFYLSYESFIARFEFRYEIEDPYVRLYQICKDLTLNKQVAIRNYQAADQQQENDIIQNMESYIQLGDIEGMCKLVAFTRKQQTQTISAAFQYDDFSLEEALKNRKFFENRNKLYTFVLKQLIMIINDAKEKGIIIQQLIPSSILISNRQEQVYRLKVLYDEREKKYDKIQQGIKVLASSQKLQLAIVEGQQGSEGNEQSIYQLGLLLIDLMYECQIINEMQNNKDGLLKKDSPLSRTNILHKSYLIFGDDSKIQLNYSLLKQKINYLKQLNNPIIKQLVALSQKMISEVSSRVVLEDLRVSTEKILVENKMAIDQPLKFITPHKKYQETNENLNHNNYLDKGNTLSKIVSQTTLATPLIISLTDNKTNDQQSLYDRPNQQSISLEIIALKVKTNSQMKQKMNVFMGQLQLNIKNIIKKQYLDGSVYYGQINKNGKRSGKGIFTCINGDIYFGIWGQNALLEGNYIFKNGQSFQGLVKNGKQGFGKYHYINGNIYEGQFQNDVKSGYGKMKYPNEDIYQGLWARGKKNGQGKYYYNNGVLYEGNFVDGKKSGFGIITFPEKTKIQAYWNKTHIEGQGKVFYHNGNYFEGNYYQSEKSGQGMYLWQDIKYQGQFFKDNMHGTAVIRYSENQFYEGSIKNGKRDGKGYYKYANGDQFRGDWKNDEKLYGHYKFYEGREFQGRFKGNEVNFGVMRYECGQSYQGQFKDGLREGEGIYRDSKGFILLEGRWNNDEYMNTI